MTRQPLEISFRARRDLATIHEFIARDNRRAANEFVGRLYDTFEMLASQPHAGERRDDLRIRLRVFSFEEYVIAFMPTQVGVRIVRVLHGKRNWQSIIRPE